LRGRTTERRPIATQSPLVPEFRFRSHAPLRSRRCSPECADTRALVRADGGAADAIDAELATSTSLV
jgi:hypothetical protein